MQMEYEQPIHIEHETESTDEETENPTEASFRIDTGFWLDDAIQLLIGWERHLVRTVKLISKLSRMISPQQTLR